MEESLLGKRGGVAAIYFVFWKKKMTVTKLKYANNDVAVFMLKENCLFLAHLKL
jgi:hypothetical protein